MRTVTDSTRNFLRRADADAVGHGLNEMVRLPFHDRLRGGGDGGVVHRNL